MTPRAAAPLHALVLGALVVLAFGASLGFEFVWDDRLLIVDNPHIKDLEGTRRVLVQDFWAVGDSYEEPSRKFYRPVISLSYAWDHALWGLDPRGFHRTNLVAHGLASLLAYLVAFLLVGSRGWAFLAAALFAVHPSHVENVCWISGRTDIFCAVFYFLALAAFLAASQGRGRPWIWVLLTLAAYAAALLSKETAVTFPLVALAAQLLTGKAAGRSRPMIALGAGLAIATVLYLALRASVLGEAISPATYGTLRERFLSIPVVFGAYLAGLATLLPLDPHHDTAFVQSVLETRFLAGVCVSLVYVVSFVRLVRRGSRLVALMVAWIPLMLAPVFKLGSFGDVLHADRFLYLPSFPFAILLVLLASRVMERARLPATRTAVSAILGLLILAWSGGARLYSAVWQDDVTLFESAARTSPRSGYIAYNLAAAYAKAGERELAVRAYARALLLNPGYSEAVTSLGISLTFLGKHVDALRCYERALEQDFRHPVLYAGMAVSLRALGRLEEAIARNRDSLALAESIVARNNLAECLLEAGQVDEARQHLEKAAAIEVPGGLSPEKTVSVHYNFVKYHLAAGDRESAIRHARTVLETMKEVRVPETVEKEAAWLQDLVKDPSGKPRPPAPWGGLRVVDAHAHIGSFAGYDIGLEPLMDNVRRYGIARALVSNIDGANLAGTTACLDEKAANDATLAAVRAHPELVGLAWGQPGRGSAETLRPFLEQGFRGIKLHPRFDRFAADDEVVDPYFVLAKTKGVPVVVHCDEATPIHRAARRHPEVPVVLYHAGFFKDHEEAIRTVESAIQSKDADLYLETSQVEPAKAVEMVKRAGASRVIFGTDATYYGKDHYAKYTAQLEALRAALSPDDLAKILHGNAERLFGLMAREP